MTLRAYILRPTGKVETTVRKTWDVVSIHHGESPPPHLAMDVMRQFLVVENWQLLDSTGLDEEVRAQRFRLGQWPVIAYPYQAIAIDANGNIEQRVRSMRWLDPAALPAALRADVLTVGKPVPRVDAAKVSLTIRTRTKPTGTVTRGTGGILR